MDTVFIIKVISSLVYPLGLATLFFCLGFIAKQQRRARLCKMSIVVALSILLISSNPKFARWVVQSLEQQYLPITLDGLAKHDAIIVLGGGIQVPDLPKARPQLGRGSDRYWLAAQAYMQGSADLILLTGGNVYTQKGIEGEAFYAAQIMRAWGVPNQMLRIEGMSRTTAQNFARSWAFINENNLKKVILVTSAYHMPRALLEFRLNLRRNTQKEGLIEITPLPADILAREYSTPELLQWIPSAHALSLSTIAAHEYYGIWFTKLKALIRKG